MKQFLKKLLHFDNPPKVDKDGCTICYCGHKIFGASYGTFLVRVTCRKCEHWWWEL